MAGSEAHVFTRGKYFGHMADFLPHSLAYFLPQFLPKTSNLAILGAILLALGEKLADFWPHFEKWQTFWPLFLTLKCRVTENANVEFFGNQCGKFRKLGKENSAPET